MSILVQSNNLGRKNLTTKKIIDVFGYVDDKTLEIVEELIDRVDFEDPSDSYDLAADAVDSGLIYNCDQWQIMSYYQNPSDADYSEAVNSLIQDIAAVINSLR